MMAAWMLYTIVVGWCAVATALAVEPLLAARGVPRRVGWVAALLAAVVVPMGVAVRPATVGSIAGVGAPLPVLSAFPAGVAPGGTTVDWDRWLVMLWGATSAAIVLLLAASAVALWRARRRARPVVLDGARVALTRDTGPGALWFGATRIVLPEALVSLDPSRRALLVRHEAEHVRAGDPHLLVASLAALALMPWNPALWIVARRLRAALELDCDARVLAAGADVQTYGELLLTVAATRRPPRFAAYLAFAAPPSPLERRIRAMTSLRRPLAPLAQLSLGLVALAAIVTACEARRPDPVAPVTSFTVADGQVTPSSAPTAAQADSMRQRLGTEVRTRVPGPTLNGNANDPLVMVYDADGTVILTGRLGAKDAEGRLMLDSLPVPADAIASVDVIKSGAMLPAEAKGGLIKVVLKAGPMKRTMMPAEGAGQVRARESRDGTPQPRELLVIVSNSEGKELYREVLPAQAPGRSGGPLDTLPVDPSAIASVDVFKSPTDRAAGRAEVRVVLKPGQGLRDKR